jgi:hypothetical protein
MRIVLIATFLFGIISCENKNGNKPTIPTDTVVIKEEKPKEHMVGGPCTYRTDTLPARLIKLEPSGKQYNAWFVAQQCRNCGEDTISYHLTNNQYIAAAAKEQLVVGKNYQLLDQQIISGTCTPHIQQILLVEYTP